MTTDETPFADLPAALVEEVIGQTVEVSEVLLDSFKKIKKDKSGYRNKIIESEFLWNESELGYPPLPTTCATDGSYGIERLLSSDLVAAAAVAVEGLTPPSEKRHWEQPRHITYIKSEIHHVDTATIVRAIMLGSELNLATKAPHDLVMLDGTLTLPIIFFNQALNKSAEALNLVCSNDFRENICEYLRSYLDILKSERSDKNYIGLPKYSTLREIGKLMDWPSHHDDRGILTFVLNPGELTKPIKMQKPESEWHINTKKLPKEYVEEAGIVSQEAIECVKQIHILYYKPHSWIPALRIELPQNIALNKHRLAFVIQGIKHQSATSAMLEPYPNFLADKTVKSLARALPAFRHITTQRISEKYLGDIGEVFFAMHGYRSESGRK